MAKNEHSSEENIELAKEHVKLAEDIILEESKKCVGCNGNCDCNEEKVHKLEETAFALEKTESKIEELESLENTNKS